MVKVHGHRRRETATLPDKMVAGSRQQKKISIETRKRGQCKELREHAHEREQRTEEQSDHGNRENDEKKNDLGKYG